MKKMRRLIPAVAMLMVAAVMLSTASFAWFTMNEQVTATGMNVQAKASGNLLISTDLMTAADQKISVDLDSTKEELSPVSYIDGGWKVPAADVVVDPTFGTLGTETFVAAQGLDYGNSNYFADYTIYLATAGDASEMTNQTLYVNLATIVGAEQKIAPAYSIAFYVDKNYNGEIDYATELDKTINYEDFTNENGHTPVTSIDLTGTYNIPSTYGATADNKVGLKVVMRVYVDGNLDAAAQTVKVPDIKAVTGNIAAADDKKIYYNPDTMGDYKFYDAEGNEVSKAEWHSGTEIGAYDFWNGTTMKDSAPIATKYVNNAWVPTGSTTFSITIGAKDAPTAP